MSIMRVRATLEGLNGLPGLHTTYWNGTTATPTSGDADDCVDRVRAFWNSFAGFLADGMVVTPSGTVDVIQEGTGALVGSLPASTTSVVSTGGTAAPLATMMLLKYQTADIVNGRRLQGRSFIGPLEATVNTGGFVAAAANTALLTAAAFLSTGGATASELVVWHRPSAVAPSGGSVGVVTGFDTSLNFAVLRSRRD